MGIFCRTLYQLGSSMNSGSVSSLYSRVASALGFDSGMEVTMNHQQNLCPCEDVVSQNQSGCVNSTCHNPVSVQPSSSAVCGAGIVLIGATEASRPKYLGRRGSLLCNCLEFIALRLWTFELYCHPVWQSELMNSDWRSRARYEYSFLFWKIWQVWTIYCISILGVLELVTFRLPILSSRYGSWWVCTLSGDLCSSQCLGML